MGEVTPASAGCPSAEQNAPRSPQAGSPQPGSPQPDGPRAKKNISISVARQSGRANSGYARGTMAERFSMVWPLTCEVVSLSKKHDIEQPLQRHIVNIVIKKASAGKARNLADAEALEGNG